MRSVQIKEMLEQTVVLKLNGGLGTGMGLEQAKSLLQVKEGKSFLAIIAEQAWPHPSTRARTHTHTHTHTHTFCYAVPGHRRGCLWPNMQRDEKRGGAISCRVVTIPLPLQVMSFRKTLGNVRVMFMNSFSTRCVECPWLAL